MISSLMLIVRIGLLKGGAVKGEGPLHSLGANLASRIGDTPTRRNNTLFGRQSWRLLD